MRQLPKANGRLNKHILRALNKIRKPSTAEEITELVNRELDPEERPFQTREVANWLRNAHETVLNLYWLDTCRVRRSRRTPVRGCDYGVPATRVARLPRTTGNGSTQRMMSWGPTRKRDGPDVAPSLATPENMLYAVGE
jgi:hypothetical protein